MDHTIIVGTDLNGRKIVANIPDTTEITTLKYIAKVNDNNYIAENKMTVEGQTGECSVGYYHYLNGETEETAIFYIRNSTGVVTNLTNFTLPDDFGVCTEIDDTAVLYDYIKRNCHEKVYVICEDFCREESMTKDQIKDNVNEQVRGYGVPIDTVMGFMGTEDEIPAGFELSDEEIGSGGSGADEYINKLNTYSTEEQRIGTWEGKPLYRKVIEATFELPSVDVVTQYKIDHNISNINKVVNVRMTDGAIVMPSLSMKGGITVLQQVNSTQIVIRYINDSWSSRKWYFILEYTKTTD